MYILFFLVKMEVSRRDRPTKKYWNPTNSGIPIRLGYFKRKVLLISSSLFASVNYLKLFLLKSFQYRTYFNIIFVFFFNKQRKKFAFLLNQKFLPCKINFDEGSNPRKSSRMQPCPWLLISPKMFYAEQRYPP